MHRQLVLAATVGAAACGASDSGGGERPLGEATGAAIVVVEARDPDGGRAPAWHVSEVTSLGGVDAPEETSWSRVVGIVARPDGGVAIADELAREIRLFDGEGEHLVTVGGRGEGPAELERIAAVATLADTLAVWDWSLRKLALWSFDGGFLGSRPFGADVFALGFPERFERLPSGDFLVVSRTTCRIPARDGDNEWRVSLVSGDGSRTRTLRAQAREDVISLYGPPGSFCVTVPFPFAGRNLVARLPSGKVALVDPASYEVRIHPDAFGLDGSVAGGEPAASRILRVKAPPAAVSDAALRMHRESQRARELEPAKIRMIMDTLDAHRIPAVWPRVDRIEADDAGRLWLRRTPTLSSDLARWDVVDPRSGRLGHVEMPTELEIRAVRSGRIFGIVREDLDVPVVKIYEVVEPPR